MGPSYWQSSESSLRMWHVSRVIQGSTFFFFRRPGAGACAAAAGGGGGAGEGSAWTCLARAAMLARRFSVAFLIDRTDSPEPPSDAKARSRAMLGRYITYHTTDTCTTNVTKIAMLVVRLPPRAAGAACPFSPVFCMANQYTGVSPRVRPGVCRPSDGLTEQQQNRETRKKYLQRCCTPPACRVTVSVQRHFRTVGYTITVHFER